MKRFKPIHPLRPGIQVLIGASVVVAVGTLAVIYIVKNYQ